MKIYFTEENQKSFNQYVDEIVKSNFWSDGKMVELFEEDCEKYLGMPACAVTNGGSALYLLYQYAGVKGKEVIIPTNTFWATAAAAKLAGANVIYADCNKEDLSLSYEDVLKRVTQNTAAITVVHIGGHIAFDIEKIAAFCKKKKIALIEDCAHAHGAEWNGRKPGSWGIGGAYSFYATKTITTGEGGVIVSKDKDLIHWMKIQRNYGKEVEGGKIKYPSLTGFNFRISEFTASLGRIQLCNLPAILEWKQRLSEKYDQIFERKVNMPYGMKSGLYKYIVFDYNLKEQSGKVFQTSDHCHKVEGDFTKCNYSKFVTALGADGYIYPCPQVHLGIRYRMGEVTKAGYDNWLRSNEQNEWYQKNPRREEYCKTCFYRPQNELLHWISNGKIDLETILADYENDYKETKHELFI